jgi:hypothetical protein
MAEKSLPHIIFGCYNSQNIFREAEMNKVNLALAAVIIILLAVLAAVLWPRFQPAQLPPPPAAPKTATQEAAKALPKVITLFQKGEGESDLAVFVGKELARQARGLAAFSLVDTSDEPQMLEYYGVSSVPAVIFISPAGKVYKVHEGYLDKAAILATLKSMK